MLSKVLSYLKAGGDANPTTIARKLGIEEGTVILLLEQLVSIGYLERLNDKELLLPEACSERKCLGCPQLTTCKPILQAKYKLIKKKSKVKR